MQDHDYISWFLRSMRSARQSRDRNRETQLFALLAELPCGIYFHVMQELMHEW